MRCCKLLLVLIFFPVLIHAQQNSPLLKKLFSENHDSIFINVTNDPAKRLQVIYTEINRDKNNIAHFTNHYFNFDPDLYFNPASTVKLPLALLSLEKLHNLDEKNINKNTRIVFDSSAPWHKSLYIDTTSTNGNASIGHFIKRAFLISENDPYNRMYQFVGQQEINRNLHAKGYTDVRITRQFMGLTSDQNRVTNPVRFLDANGKTIYKQAEAVNKDSFDFKRDIKLGKAHLNSNDSLVYEPFDFTKHNNLSLLDLQQMLQSVMFPYSVPAKQRFNLSKEDYSFLRQYLSQFPSETPVPKYDTVKFYDSYVKFFFRNASHKLPDGVRVFNKVGWSYGFLTDVSYVADFKNNVEYMLAATLYVNSDEVLNDGKYDYDRIGYPFLYQLGQLIYQYELKRKRKYKPALSEFRVKYEKRDPNDPRKPLTEVDN
jgi:hypothetical protein